MDYQVQKQDPEELSNVCKVMEDLIRMQLSIFMVPAPPPSPPSLFMCPVLPYPRSLPSSMRLVSSPFLPPTRVQWTCY